MATTGIHCARARALRTDSTSVDYCLGGTVKEMDRDMDQDSGSKPWEMVTRRAIEDPDFRERLIDDPRSTIAESTGHEVPDDVDIVVVENGPKTFHIVLPSSELGDLDVSGGIPGLFCGPPGLSEQCMMLC